MEEKEVLAKNLIKFRKNAGLSQLELAKKLNYSNKNISKWEKGETMPNAFVLQKIAQIYGVKIEDLLSEQTPCVEEKPVEEKPKKNIRKTLFRLVMLVMANAILFASGIALVYILKLLNIRGFNLNLIYLYLAPFSFLSVTIYIRVIYKFVDIISLSAFGWLICLSLYLSCLNVPNMAYIFVLAGGYEVIEVCIALLVNLKIFKNKK